MALWVLGKIPSTTQNYNQEPHDTTEDPTPYLEPTSNSYIKIGVHRKVNCSEWGAPTFVIPKQYWTIRFISDFRELNNQIKRKPYPIPKIQDLLLKVEGFTYATLLDLNMGLYHIELTPNLSAQCTIVLPWGKYEYLKLLMGLSNSPERFPGENKVTYSLIQNT